MIINQGAKKKETEYDTEFIPERRQPTVQYYTLFVVYIIL